MSPSLCFGTAQFGLAGITIRLARLRATVKSLLAQAYRWCSLADTAQVYGNAEAVRRQLPVAHGYRLIKVAQPKPVFSSHDADIWEQAASPAASGSACTVSTRYFCMHRLIWPNPEGTI